jgi:hypothetical protein
VSHPNLWKAKAAVLEERGLEPPIDLQDPVDRVAVAILSDVTDRRGWRQEWNQFDDDIQCEIVNTWRERIRLALANPPEGT